MFSVGYGFGRNCIILGVNMMSFVRVDNKKIYIYLSKNDTFIISDGLTQGLDDTTLTENSTKNNNVWACIIMEQTVI